MSTLLQKNFHDNAYGMFIHYGLYSIYARGEWVMSKERMSNEEYFKVVPQFKTDAAIAESWVKTAYDSGMKYAVLTTRHHDGFYIGDELIAAFCNACHKYGLDVGLYYSVGDWSDFDFRGGASSPKWCRFVEKTHRQIIDLMTRFGTINYLFYDGCPLPNTWNAAELHVKLRQLQPELLISSRCGLDEDISSSEQNSNAHKGTWESCYTINNTWGYHQYDTNWKTSEEIIRTLMCIRHNGGNLLLNVGPKPDGAIQEEALKILGEVKIWLDKNREAVFDVSAHPFDYKDQEISTGRDNVAYIMLQNDYPGQRRIITGIGNKVLSINLLDSKKIVNFIQQKDVIVLTDLPAKQILEKPRILRIELEGLPVGVHNPMWPENNFRVC